MGIIWIIANSDSVKNVKISDNDIVVRFNSPRTTTFAKTGFRTDYLFLANTVDVLSKMLMNDLFFKSYYRSLHEKAYVVLPYSDELIKKINPYMTVKNITGEIKLVPNWDNNGQIERLKNIKNNKLNILSDDIYFHATKLINPAQGKIISTGLLAINYFINTEMFEHYNIVLNGFTFKGWPGHDWEQEKLFIEKVRGTGRVNII